MPDQGETRRLDIPRIAADVRLAVERRNRVVEQVQQGLIDAQVAESRRALRRALRRRGGDGLLGFVDDGFLAVADRPTVWGAIVDAAVVVGGATCVDLQVWDAFDGVLRIVAQQGFTAAFISYFAAVGVGQPTACATALTTRKPVQVDDVRRSAIFAGHPSLDVLLGAGSKAVYSYPLVDSGGTLSGVLSFHHPRAVEDRRGAILVARCAAEVLPRFT